MNGSSPAAPSSMLISERYLEPVNTGAQSQDLSMRQVRFLEDSIQNLQKKLTLVSEEKERLQQGGDQIPGSQPLAQSNSQDDTAAK